MEKIFEETLVKIFPNMIRTVPHILQELSETQKYKHKEIHNFKVKLLKPKEKKEILSLREIQ